MVDQYRSHKPDALNMLFVNARSFGSGLNLENTTDIIMFHKLDSELEKQVIGRAQRFGRSEPLNIWYLLHENEMVTAAA
jgi:SNF2 family DNA or RNA helicase